MPIYLQHGNLIDYVSPTDTTTDDVVFMGGLVGVPQTFIPAGEVGALSVDGVYIFNKKEGVTVTLGDVVKYCGTTKLAQDSHADLTLGVAVADADADDLYTKVKINSVLPSSGGGGGGCGEVSLCGASGLYFDYAGNVAIKYCGHSAIKAEPNGGVYLAVCGDSGLSFGENGELVASGGGCSEVSLCGNSGLYLNNDGEVTIMYCTNGAIGANENGLYLRYCSNGLSINNGMLYNSKVMTIDVCSVCSATGLSVCSGVVQFNICTASGLEFQNGSLTLTCSGGGGGGSIGLTDNNSFIVTGNDTPFDPGDVVNIGFCTSSRSNGSVILGAYTDNCSSSGAVAIGYKSRIDYNSTGGIAIGSCSRVTMEGCGSIAIGSCANTNGCAALAIGREANTSANYSTALGFNANASDIGSTVLSAWNDGGSAKTQFKIIGAGSTASTTKLGGKSGIEYEEYNTSGTITNSGAISFDDLVSGGSVGTTEADKTLKILFIGNSLTQDAVSYLPLLLDEIAPEIKYTIYDWYNGGNTLAQQYSKITANTACENFGTITNNQSGGWTTERNTVTMKWICDNCDFDIVVMQEYSYYEFTDSAEITNFNNIISWLRTNYNKPFKVYSFIDAPMRTRIESDYAKAKKYAKLQITNSVSEGLVNPGTAVVYGIEDSLLNTLGDRGQLTGDGTHTQEGLPCMLQSYVLALWVFDWLSIPKSVLNSKIKMTAELYSTWQSLGPNLGSGVVEGTEAQYRRAQEVAISAYKFGKQLLNSAINTFNEGEGDDNPGSGGGGTTEEITTEISTEGGCLSTSLAVGSEPATFANQYTTDYDVYKATIDSTKTYTITISTGLYDTDGNNMPIIAICDANNLVVGIVNTQQNTQTVHQEQFIIDMTDYDGASYILMTVFEDEFSIVEGELQSADVTIAHAGSIFKESTAVGEAYGVGSSVYTKDYNLYQADNTAGGKFSLTITHGLYSSSGTPPPAIVICDSEGIVLELIRCQTNIQSVRTETYTVDMTLFSNASYFVFATQGDEYFISAIA